jgi:hypothetical protein
MSTAVDLYSVQSLTMQVSTTLALTSNYPDERRGKLDKKGFLRFLQQFVGNKKCVGDFSAHRVNIPPELIRKCYVLCLPC